MRLDTEREINGYRGSAETLKEIIPVRERPTDSLKCALFTHWKNEWIDKSYTSLTPLLKEIFK